MNEAATTSFEFLIDGLHDYKEREYAKAYDMFR